MKTFTQAGAHRAEAADHSLPLWSNLIWRSRISLSVLTDTMMLPWQPSDFAKTICNWEQNMGSVSRLFKTVLKITDQMKPLLTTHYKTSHLQYISHWFFINWQIIQVETTYAQKSSTVANLEMRRKLSVQLLLLSFLKYQRAHLRERLLDEMSKKWSMTKNNWFLHPVSNSLFNNTNTCNESGQNK